MGKIVSEVGRVEFAEVFRHNLNNRSKTAQGESDVSQSPGKKRCLLAGEALKQQVAHNTELLIRSVWMNNKWPGQGAREVRELVESWNVLVNNGLPMEGNYGDEQAEVHVRAKALAEETGKKHRMNRLYRVVTPPYLMEPLPPEMIEVAMDAFYLELGEKTLAAYYDRMSQAELLAWADYQMEKVIHPWADGCGRTATALVMWLSLLDPVRFHLPVFGTRGEHHKRENLGMHIVYFERCLERQLSVS